MPEPLPEDDLTRAMRAGISKTTDGDLAAIQMVLGCSPIKGNEIENVYTEAKPYEKGKPGILTWCVQTHSETFPGTTAGHIKKGYLDDGAIGEALAAKLEQIEDEKLRDEIQTMFPQAVASFCRGALTNRRKIAGWWRGAVEWVLIKQGKKTFIMDRRAKGLAKRWGVN